MFRTRRPEPAPLPPEQPETAPVAVATGLPEFGWSWAALVAAPLVAVGIPALGAPAGLWAAVPALLLLAMAGTTPRRLILGAVRLALRLPWRAWVLVAGSGAAVALWFGGETLFACAAAGLALGPIFTAAWGAGLRPPRERTPPVNVSPDKEWRARVEDRWPGTAERAGLHRSGDPSAVVALVEPPKLVRPGMLHLRLNTEPAELLPEDVSAAIPTMTRVLRAGEMVVRPVNPHDPDLVDVWLWRGRHPLDVPVTWRDLVPLDDPSGEWVPVGRLATGGPARMRWRESTGYFGASETGKTTAQRALLYGMRVQRVPLAGGLHIVDTLGDYRPWRDLLGDRYAGTMREAVPLVERFAERVQDRYDQLDHGEEVRPATGRPALILMIAEGLHLRQHRAGYGKEDAARVDTALRYITGSGRRSAAAVHVAYQLSQKDETGGWRDLLPQRLCMWVPEESMVDPALGSGAADRGARAHALPRGLKGAAYLIDPDSRWPALMRPGLIRADEVHEVFRLDRTDTRRTA